MATLPQIFVDLNDITTADRTVGTVYGRRADGTLVSVKVDNNGVLYTTTSITAGSANSYFSDQVVTALSGTFQNFAFGFTSINITLFNDSNVEVIEFSFDGTNVHGRLKSGEGITQDFRSQSSIWLKTVSGNPSDYRLMVY